MNKPVKTSNIPEPGCPDRTEHWQFSGASFALPAVVYLEVGGSQTSRKRFGKASPARLCRAKVAYCVSGVSLGLISTSVAPLSSAS